MPSVSCGTDTPMDGGGGEDNTPSRTDPSVRFSTSIGGLKEHIKCLREMVIFPLMYPELFEKFNTQPAKGVLFHGPPGTGKTLLARALANECSLVSGKKFTFFMRKASDCFDKYIGESERKIREIFQSAHRLSPSIIFFDEIDALAPVRQPSALNHGPSVVATLLAEMDGISDRGDIIVIGATNRPDAIDPAMRRPGRFDRELYFPPPETEARCEILKIYTKDWQPQPSEQLLRDIAKATSGYLGSDIKALCSEAVLKAVRRVYPQIYDTEYKLLVDAKNVNVTQEDMLSAMSMLSPSAARSNPLPAQPLPEHIKPLLETQVNEAYEMLRAVLPPVPVFKARKPAVSTPSVFLVSGPCAETLLAPALLAKLEASTVKELSLTTLVNSIGKCEAQTVISMFAECRQASGVSVLFIRDVETVWDCLLRHEAAAVMMQLWKTQALGDSTLLLAASSVGHERLPLNIQGLFPQYKQCVYNVRQPTADEVTDFFKPMVTVIPLLPPVVETHRKPPPLPRAPSPGPHMTEEAIARRRDEEAVKMRQLWNILYNIYHDNLAADSRFEKFIKPVDLKKEKNHLDVIKRPMDLYTVLSKINMEQYFCAREFLDDIDLICANALEYSPDGHISNKKLRLDVCALRDIAYNAVNDEVPSELELECQIIARRRRSNGKGGSSPPRCSFYVADLSPLSFMRNIIPDLNIENFPGERKRQASSSHHHSDRKRRRSSSHNLSDRKNKKNETETRKTEKRRCEHHSRDHEDRNEQRHQHESRHRPGVKVEKKFINEGQKPGPSARPPSHNGEPKAGPSAPPPPPNGEPKAGPSSPLPSPNEVPNTDPVAPAPPEGEPMDDDKDLNSIPKEILINVKDMEEILNKNVGALSVLGLERLIELYGDFSKTVHAYSRTYNRLKLPQELGCIMERYLQLANNEPKVYVKPT